MECSLCEKSQYVRKSEYNLNLRINTHRNDVCRTDGPPCNKHFQIPGHNFNVHAKFAIIEEVCKKSLSKLKIRSLLEHRENFWIFKLQTLSPQYIYIYIQNSQKVHDGETYCFQSFYPKYFVDSQIGKITENDIF